MEAGGCEGTGNRMRLGPEQGSAERGDGLEPQGESGAQSPSRGRGAEGRRPGQGRPTPRGPGRRPQGPPGLRGPAGAGVPSRPGPEGSPGLCRSPFSGARRSSRGRRTRPGHGAGTPTAAAPRYPFPRGHAPLPPPDPALPLPQGPAAPALTRGQPRVAAAAAASRQCRPASERQRAAPARSAPAPRRACPPRDARLPAGARPLPSGPGRPPSLRSHWLLAPGARVASRAGRVSLIHAAHAAAPAPARAPIHRAAPTPHAALGRARSPRRPRRPRGLIGCGSRAPRHARTHGSARAQGRRAPPATARGGWAYCAGVRNGGMAGRVVPPFLRPTFRPSGIDAESLRSKIQFYASAESSQEQATTFPKSPTPPPHNCGTSQTGF